jgi:2-iminobutanoate/2-iminopropanoate deaminase
VERDVIGTEGPTGLSTSAVRGNGFVFTTGTIGTDPTTGNLPEDLESQTRNTLATLEGVLRRAGTELEMVVKVNVYLDDIEGDFDQMNEVYRDYFRARGIAHPPARTTVGCRLPWSRVEIDMVALA